MAMTPLSVDDINTAIISQVEAQIGTTVPIIPIAFVRVLAKAIAAVVVLVYKYTSFIYLQLFVATASDQPTTIGGKTITPLTEWGRLVGAGDPVPAVAAELTADVTVPSPFPGTPLPAGTALVNDITGVIYLTTASILLDAATKSITVEASSDQAGGDGLGAVGNLDNGAILSFASPVAGALRDTVVTSTVTSGEDGEATENYRQRIIDRFQKPPQGGALADYEAWGEEAAGIINVYPYTGDIPGTVEVYCEADPVSSGSPDGIPTQAQLDAALDSINLDVAGRATRRPANALALTLPITRKQFEVEVVGLDAPDPSATETAISDGLDTLFAGFEPFIGGLTVTPRDRVTVSEVGGVVHDIASANNATFSSVLVKTKLEAQTVYTAGVISSSNDARETAGVVTLTDSTLAIAPANLLGFRFENVNIPAGSVVLSATLTLTSSSTKTPYSVFHVRGEAVDDSAVFVASANNISGRPTTVNVTDYIPTNWATDETHAIDIAAQITEIIGISGWAALNSMSFILSSDTGSDRDAYAYDGDPAKVASLSITFTSSATAFSTASVTTLRKGEKAKVISVTFS